MHPTGLYRAVPKDIRKNLAYRRAVHQACKIDAKARADYLAAAKKDCLFWVNTFVWLYEPREMRVLPFVTWDVQDDLFKCLMDNFGKKDVCVLKSRDMGASWCDLVFKDWGARHLDLCSFLLCSRKEGLVDKRGESDTLFSKLDFVDQYLPWWMRQKRERQMLMVQYPETKSSITGTSTTGDVGRGGRKTSMLFDEFAKFSPAEGSEANASSLKTSRNRVFLSTPDGAMGEFYEIWNKPSDSIVKFQMHWTRHPRMSRGMYTSTDGVLKLLDATYWADPQRKAAYKFILDGKTRSPEYDYYCERATTAAQIAQELDCDFIGSGAQFFDVDMLRRCEAMYARDEDAVGDLLFTGTDLAGEKTFVEAPQGRMRLWLPVDDFSAGPPPDDYVLGADISSGTGASNTCFIVANKRTGEQVAEFCSPNIRPVDAARYAVALAWWFKNKHGEGARMIWEGNGGPGRNFGDAVSKDYGYRRIYYQKSERKLVPTETDNPGWWSTRENKVALLSEFAEAIGSGRFVPRSREVYVECREYQYTSDGGIDHVRSLGALDPSGAGQNHGDRAIAAALASRLTDIPNRLAHAREDTVHPNSPAGWDLRDSLLQRKKTMRYNWTYAGRRTSSQA